MGVLRWRSRLDAEIATASSQPLSKLDLEILIALRLALYQFLWLDRIPQRAALHESVELVKRARKRSAAPFVNAVLRKLSTATPKQSYRRNHFTPNPWPAPSPIRNGWSTAGPTPTDSPPPTNLPAQSIRSPTTAIRLRTATAEAATHARGNHPHPRRSSRLRPPRPIRRHHENRTPSAPAKSSFRTKPRNSSPPWSATRAEEKSRILDCCAAPGGKTLAIADHNPEATITAVELHPHRARLLQKLLHATFASESRAPNRIQIITADAQHLPLTQQFDRVLADVPCSGTGTLARNPEIKWRLTPNDLAELPHRQLAILRSALAQVAPGGRLIYSTCSLEKEENENVVEQALSENNSFRLLDCRTELDRLKESGELTWPDPASTHAAAPTFAPSQASTPATASSPQSSERVLGAGDSDEVALMSQDRLHHARSKGLSEQRINPSDRGSVTALQNSQPPRQTPSAQPPEPATQ